jgi:2-oxoglutarate/2-oxoacid ferredoxin oxidoreductase subunit beta
VSCAIGCSLLASALAEDKIYQISEYESALPRWCAGCGDHSVLTAMQRLLAAEQLKPEQTVFVSGIGCSSRFPHYVKTYGFHGIHGRALPLATGVKLSRPDLNVFVVMGDGDCTSIGAGHWVHSIRYNLDMVALMLDNNIYGLTKNQTSPTTPQGFPSRTQPQGSWLPALNPLSTTLGVTNASFVAQTAEWIPAHLYATLQAAHRHRGFAFVRILQRCPEFTPQLYADAVKKPDRNQLLVHDDGVVVPELEKSYRNRVVHDPSDLDAARRLAEDMDVIRLGLLYRNETRPIYEETRRPIHQTIEEKFARLEQEFDRYAV